MTYVTGFDILGGGATAASIINVTLAGLQAGTMTFAAVIASTVSAQFTAGGVMSIRFPDPLPASAPGTAIAIAVPSFGSGNTNAGVVLYGLIPQ